MQIRDAVLIAPDSYRLSGAPARTAPHRWSHRYARVRRALCAAVRRALAGTYPWRARAVGHQPKLQGSEPLAGGDRGRGGEPAHPLPLA